MATGDIKNNLGKLQSELRGVNFSNVDYDQLSKGVPLAYLPIYHHVLMNYSKSLAEKISDIGVDIYGKSDMRFIEAMYKVLRELFAYKPPLTKDQFFNSGYSEKKVIMCSEIIGLIKSFHKENLPKKPKSAKCGKSNMSSAVATAGAIGITMSHVSKSATKPSVTVTRTSQKSAKEPKQGEKVGSSHDVRPVGARNKESANHCSTNVNCNLESSDGSNDVVDLSAIDPASPHRHFQDVPINIIASTPCPPGPCPTMKDVRANTMEKHEYIGQINHILKKMQEVQNKMVCIEDRMSAMEKQMGTTHQTEHAASTCASSAPLESEDVLDPVKLENLLARMTVIEHKVEVLDAKPDVIKQASVSFPGSVQQTSVTSSGDGTCHEPELAANLVKPFDSLENQQNDTENITVDEGEGKKSDKKTSSPIQTAAFKSLHLHGEFESSPSPIPMKKLASRVLEQGSLYLTKDMSSFGELNLGKIETDSFGTECSQEDTSKIIDQRQRIAAMMTDTEKMLSMNENEETKE